MNIFFLDRDPVLCAQYHNDKHCVKMILEYAQLLSTAHHVLDGYKEGIYRKTHTSHPSAKWVRMSVAHYVWLHELWLALMREYTYRYERKHASSRLKPLLWAPPDNILLTDWLCDPTPAMPANSFTDSLTAYRWYYRAHKAHIAKWTKRNVPYFMESDNGNSTIQ